MIGWVDRLRAARLAAIDDVFRMDTGAIAFAPTLSDVRSRTHALDRVTRVLAAEGALTAWRDERYAIAPAFGAPPWFLLERAAARYFGVRTFAAHVNGLVDERGALSMWFARRSDAKAIDPGMLDNLVGGGIAAGQSVADTVIKESGEEAGIDPEIARSARAAGTVEIRRIQPDGLQRETIFVHDLLLPADFAPVGRDGEAVAHRRVDFAGAARLIANGERSRRGYRRREPRRARLPAASRRPRRWLSRFRRFARPPPRGCDAVRLRAPPSCGDARRRDRRAHLAYPELGERVANGIDRMAHFVRPDGADAAHAERLDRA